MITILDGFVDEPSCFGVKPYISPYVRYLAGAIKDAGYNYEYFTIEEWRKGRKIRGEILIIFAGAIIPGRYIRGAPISLNEIRHIISNFDGIKILGGSAARFGISQGGGKEPVKIDKFFDYSVKNDVDAFIYDYLNGNENDRRRQQKEWRRWAIYGAEIVKQHPDYPQPLIVEIETYRGCVRWFTGGCSFCSEPLFGRPITRGEGDIIKEVEALKREGVKNIRIGCQSCFFSYRAKGIGKSEVPEPNVDAIKRIMEKIHSFGFDVIHIDNANPAVIAEWEEDARKIAEIVVKYGTPGNVAAFGMESADNRVIEKNNLNAYPWEVMKAIEIINEVGKKRGDNGMPYFLPGLNFLYGLAGESKETYIKNFKFLEEVLSKKLMLRRINIRQVVNTRKPIKNKIDKSSFNRFKKLVSEKINKKMLEMVVPEGTVLRNVYLELNKGNATFGRQIGSYPILIYLPYKTKINRFVNVVIYDHGSRSVSGIEYPLNVNEISFSQLKSIPGIGEKTAAKIIRRRPFKNREEIRDILNEKILQWIKI